MPQITFPFDLNGLLVDVVVCPGGLLLGQLNAQGLPLPRPVWGRGQIDTGSNVTTVSPTILNQLNIPHGGSLSTQGISGPVYGYSYTVSLSITFKQAPGTMYSPPDVDVIGIPVADVDILIGLDVLMGCRLLIDGPARSFTLDF